MSTDTNNININEPLDWLAEQITQGSWEDGDFQLPPGGNPWDYSLMEPLFDLLTPPQESRRCLEWVFFKEIPLANPSPPRKTAKPVSEHGTRWKSRHCVSNLNSSSCCCCYQYPMTDEETFISSQELEPLFPVGYYDMTNKKRGVTQGRGKWKGKEVMKLMQCTSQRYGCEFKALFCRVHNAMEIYTKCDHNVSDFCACSEWSDIQWG